MSFNGVELKPLVVVLRTITEMGVARDCTQVFALLAPELKDPGLAEHLLRRRIVMLDNVSIRARRERCAGHGL